ncbi:hypothetical protein H5410_064384 [Solanum commersonii]|uniref:Fungal lipase-type domain-containing protein n=1 Tax=Solanum commersonii TaxID=4109 RepID=A0A9J5VZP4_SOLCO|nr:hypothetical protein H5410_064384 [Solanum commersonii]
MATSNESFLIVKPENGGTRDLVGLQGEIKAKFLEYSCVDDGGGDCGGGEEVDDHRWVIFVSILLRKLLKVLKKPMEWSGYFLEFFINLFSLNGNFLGLFHNILHDYQKQNSTQVFILCDKSKDANLILISFRGTEPFDADDWITDFNYSWYEVPKIGKLHMGFLEALGLGSRVNVSTFHEHLFDKNVDVTIAHPERKTAYYTVRSKLKSLLKEHENARFVVTGHSLGGALAILFPTMLVIHEEMDVMKRLSRVYTYGQPRVGNRQLGRFMEEHLEHPVPKYFRVVYSNDLVRGYLMMIKHFCISILVFVCTITAYTLSRKYVKNQT